MQRLKIGRLGGRESRRKRERDGERESGKGIEERRFSLQFHDEIYEAFDPPAQEIKIIKHRFYVCAASSPGRVCLCGSMSQWVCVCVCPSAAHTLSF